MLRKTGYFFMLALMFSFISCSQKTSDTSDITKNEESQLIKSASIGTHAVGGAYYAMGTGVAKIVSNKTSIQATVYPYSGPDAWMPDLREGNINMGIISGVDLSWAYKGQVNFDKPTQELRLVLNGNLVGHCTFSVLESSEFMSIKDLKGKRVGYEYGGNKFTNRLIDAALASVDLSIEDCVKVPLTDLATAQRALQEHRVDAIFTGSATTPLSVQLDQAIGIRILPFGDLQPKDIEGGIPDHFLTILDQYVPGSTLKVQDIRGTIKTETVLIHYPIDLVASAKVSEESIYEILSAIWDNYAELASINAWGAGWIPENFAVDYQSAPYHDGSIKLFKEKGMWTDSMQKQQDNLLQ